MLHYEKSVLKFFGRQGALDKNENGVAQGRIKVAGAHRLTYMVYAYNPVKASVVVDELAEDFLGEFRCILAQMMGQYDFLRRVLWSEGSVYWAYDLLVPSYSIDELLCLWHMIAEIEVPVVDGIISEAITQHKVPGEHSLRAQLPNFTFH